MENCLIQIATRFNEHEITWALGASMLLYYKGLVAKPNDIDIMVAPEEIAVVEKILNQLGEKKPPNPDANYATEHFFEYIINGIEVDVMAGFRINHAEGQLEYILKPEALDTIILKGTTIKLCPMEDWFVLYLLMPNRAERAATVAGYLLENGQANLDHLKGWLEQDISGAVRGQIQALLTQLSS